MEYRQSRGNSLAVNQAAELYQISPARFAAADRVSISNNTAAVVVKGKQISRALPKTALHVRDWQSSGGQTMENVSQ